VPAATATIENGIKFATILGDRQHIFWQRISRLLFSFIIVRFLYFSFVFLILILHGIRHVFSIFFVLILFNFGQRISHC